MMQSAAMHEQYNEKKIISVSAKRQITIPQKYFEILNVGNEVECVLQNGAILIRPIHERRNGDFAEQILADLISQGYSGNDLLAKFREHNLKIRPAVEELISKADEFVASGNGVVSIDALFGAEEN